MTYRPEDVAVWTPPTLTAAEERALAATTRQPDDPPSRGLPSRMRKATDRWSIEASHVAVGLTAATATIPPPARPPSGPRAPGITDPVGAQVHATYDTVTRAANTFAHLTGPCPLDYTRDEYGQTHLCPDGSAVYVAVAVGVAFYPPDITRRLLHSVGTADWQAAVHTAASWHTKTAAHLLDAFLDAWRTAEPSTLEDWTARTEQLARRMAALAGSLSLWNGRLERRCKAGCGGAAPPKGEGATCERCRQRHSRDRRHN